ncbi:hypothetical protein [Shewanella benthica]|uniref:Cytochrome c assembly protein domain-containing protein n=1 Tax=Shewanella benthica KT99 TaxID=314608 RepID=A9DCU0_9GAMM|nr:hypothetical protein [Shewanella benthica]EDQ00268.1 hypothetical protein KT99_07573 [Shewanella benthica KT99]
MSDTSLKPVITPFMVILTARLVNIVLFALAVMILSLINSNCLLFPGSSVTTYLVVSAIVSLASLCCLHLTNRLQAHYVFIVCFIALLMLGYSQTLEPPKGDSAMLTSIWAQLFFLSRPIALGLAIAAFVSYSIQALRNDADLDSHCHLLSLLAGTAYLGGEIAGSYWAFIGWGASWSWSGHFLFSALTYLLFVLVFHLPKVWFSNPSALTMGKAAVLGFTCVLMLGYRVL